MTTDVLEIVGYSIVVVGLLARVAGQERKSNRQTRRRSIDERLKRLADLFELGGRTKTEYVARRNDLLIEPNQLEARPAAASIALQRQQLQSVVDDWSVMTDEEKKRVLQMIFSEIRADHTEDGLKIEFRPKPIWEPYTWRRCWRDSDKSRPPRQLLPLRSGRRDSNPRPFPWQGNALPG